MNEQNVAAALKKQGKSKNDKDSKFDALELAVGTEVELEHVDDREAAKEIAKDHLVENPTYYKDLGKIEKEVKDIYDSMSKKFNKNESNILLTILKKMDEELSK
jgi:hypothetical protein